MNKRRLAYARMRLLCVGDGCNVATSPGFESRVLHKLIHKLMDSVMHSLIHIAMHSLSSAYAHAYPQRVGEAMHRLIPSPVHSSVGRARFCAHAQDALQLANAWVWASTRHRNAWATLKPCSAYAPLMHMLIHMFTHNAW